MLISFSYYKCNKNNLLHLLKDIVFLISIIKAALCGTNFKSVKIVLFAITICLQTLNCSHSLRLLFITLNIFRHNF